MSYTKFHGIMVTTGGVSLVQELRNIAKGIFGKERVTKVQKSDINGWFTFFVGPDGSKEDRTPSYVDDTCRKDFTETLRYHGVYFVEFFVTDEGDAKTERHS